MTGSVSQPFNLLIACVLLCAMTGCGGVATGTVKGKVTYNGKPVTDATVQVQSATTGAAAAAQVDGSGSYKLDSPVPVGTYVVTITPFESGPVAGENDENFVPKERTDIPSKFRSASESTLKLTVNSGENTFDVPLTDGN